MPYIISAIVAVLVVVGAGFGLNKYYTKTPEPFTVEIVETPSDAEEVPDVKTVTEKLAEQTRATTSPRPTATRSATVTPTPTPTPSIVNNGVAPVISGVRITSITSTGATVSWTTNTASDTQVEYGPLTTYGSVTPLNTTKSTSHSVQMTGLTTNKTYHIRARSRDAAGNLGVSADFSFDTLGSAVTAPEIPELSDIRSDTITSTSARIAWTTDIGADSKVEYGKTTSYASSTPLNTSTRTNHSFTLSNLLPDTTYHYRVRSKTSSTTEQISSDRTFKTSAGADTMPPQVSGIVVTDIAATSVRIKWVTNEPSDEAVEWGSTESYGNVAGNNNTGTTTHSVALSGLSAGETYHYRVRSRDEAGNTGRSGDLTFTTESAPPETTPDPDVTGPVISSVSMTPTPDTIVVQWVTNESSDSTVYYRLAGSADPEQSVTSATMTLNHQLTITGVSSSNTYTVRVSSRDAVGNTTSTTGQGIEVPVGPTPTPAP